MSTLWPVAAAACWKTTSLGLGVMPSSAMPAATAPEVTRTTLSPCFVAWVIWQVSFCISSSSSFPWLVMPFVPTLTTISLEGIV